MSYDLNTLSFNEHISTIKITFKTEIIYLFMEKTKYQLYRLNKIDRPYELLVWSENYGMTIKKIKEESFIIVGVQSKLKKIFKLPAEKQEKAICNLPYKMEKEISKKLDIKGSLPYQIRDWVWHIIRNEIEGTKIKPPKMKRNG